MKLGLHCFYCNFGLHLFTVCIQSLRATMRERESESVQVSLASQIKVWGVFMIFSLIIFCKLIEANQLFSLRFKPEIKLPFSMLPFKFFYVSFLIFLCYLFYFEFFSETFKVALLKAETSLERRSSYCSSNHYVLYIYLEVTAHVCVKYITGA